MRIRTTRQAFRLRLKVYHRDGWRMAPNGDGTFRTIHPSKVSEWVRTHIVADDPHPTYSRLDNLDGLRD